MTDPVSNSSPTCLGERAFDAADQLWFAQLSFDVNPMHTDGVAARRLLSGRQVVHGMHLLIQAIDLWQAPADRRPMAMTCSFDHPVSVGDRVQFSQTLTTAERCVIQARVDGLVCTELDIELGPTAHTANTANTALAPALAACTAQALGGLQAPLDESAPSWPGRRVVLPAQADEAALAARYPTAARAMSPGALTALAGLSYFVGMVCPGLHSVFSSLSFRLPQPVPDAGRLLLEVIRYDPRFRLFTVAFEGGLQGQLRAFQRPAPQAQPSALALKVHVREAEFRGVHALVIGGSRGLGELCAKLLAVGGAQVLLTYAQGQADAQRVADDIALAGEGGCSTLALDLSSQAFEALAVDVDSLSSVYYFATPRIYSKRAALFDAQVFDGFCHFYLRRFHELCLWLETRGVEPKVKVYLPSTVFITKRPKGIAEYAMAKAAAEVLAADLNRQLRRVEVIFTRLPRLATDQTSAIMAAATDSNVEVLLPLLRQIHG